MGAVEGLATSVGNSLIDHGPVGWLALAGWLCAVVASMVVVVIWKALRASEAARVSYLLDDKEASEKERAEQDRKMDRLQAILEAKR